MTTYTDQLLANQEAEGTSPQGATFYKAAALGIMLSCAVWQQVYSLRPDLVMLGASQRDYVDSSQQLSDFKAEVGPLEIFAQLNQVYDLLLRHSKDLDDETHKILYSNLWKLYD